MEHLEAGRFNEPPTEPVKTLQELLDEVNRISEEAEVAKLDYAKRWKESALAYNMAVLEQTIGPLPEGDINVTLQGTMEMGIKKTNIIFSKKSGEVEEGRKQRRFLNYSPLTRWVVSGSEDTVFYYLHDKDRFETLKRIVSLKAVEKDGVWRPEVNRGWGGLSQNRVGEWYRAVSRRAYPSELQVTMRALVLYADMNSEKYMLKGKINNDFYPTQDFSAALEPGSGFWDSENGIGLTETFGVTRELLEGFDETRLGDLVRHVWAPPSIELARLEPERSVKKMAS